MLPFIFGKFCKSTTLSRGERREDAELAVILRFSQYDNMLLSPAGRRAGDERLNALREDAELAD
jgi:hypothetical protein